MKSRIICSCKHQWPFVITYDSHISGRQTKAGKSSFVLNLHAMLLKVKPNKNLDFRCDLRAIKFISSVYLIFSELHHGVYPLQTYRFRWTISLLPVTRSPMFNSFNIDFMTWTWCLTFITQPWESTISVCSQQALQLKFLVFEYKHICLLKF